MFDLDAFIEECLVASRADQPRLAVKEVLDRAVSAPGAMADALPPSKAELTKLHLSDELTILKVVWAPRMSFGPHDHRLWATIGVYSGGEDNAFYRRDGDSIAATGGKSLRSSDVVVLGESTIHAVTNPTDEFAGAIHIYGGDFFATPRSEWRGEPPREQPYDADYVVDYFEQANRAN